MQHLGKGFNLAHKLQIARECALAARLWVVSASEEGRIGPSLRNVLLRRDPQLIRLDSEVAYDATAIFLWLMIAVCIGLGAWEIAAALGGLKLLGKRPPRGPPGIISPTGVTIG